jgi:hypothetical protein
MEKTHLYHGVPISCTIFSVRAKHAKNKLGLLVCACGRTTPHFDKNTGCRLRTEYLNRYSSMGGGGELTGGECKGKAVPQGSRRLRPPDFLTSAHEGGRLSASRTGRLYPQD